MGTYVPIFLAPNIDFQRSCFANNYRYGHSQEDAFDEAFAMADAAEKGGLDGVWLAERHFAEAKALAPHDFTIVRASMPLTGVDPFGPAFFELYGVFEAAGSPYRGIRRPRS